MALMSVTCSVLKLDRSSDVNEEQFANNERMSVTCSVLKLAKLSDVKEEQL